MKSYLITYDLEVPEGYSEYSGLWEYLKTFALWARPAQSVWFIKSDLGAGQIRDEIKARLKSNDKVLVIEVTNNNWGTSNVLKVVTDWMKANL